MEFIFLESETCPISAEIISTYGKFFPTNKISCASREALTTALAGKKPEAAVLFAPAEFSVDPEMLAVLEPFQACGRVLWLDGSDGNTSAIQSQDTAKEEVAKIFAQVFADNRTVGIKCFLEKGAKIYSESIFDTGVLGAKLDPCHKLARKRLGAAAALKAWATVEAVILAAFQHLPGNGDGSTGERVDMQIGSDESILGVGVRFTQTNESLSALLSHPALVIAKDQCHFFEVREIRGAKKVEVNMVFFRGNPPAASIRVIHQVEQVALERAEDAAAYGFKPMDALANEADGAAAQKVKGGFKKKFSEQVKTFSADKTVLDETVIKGDASQAEVKTTVKGGETSDAKLKELLQPVVIQGPKDKTATQLEAKILTLQEALRERDAVVKRLSKEVTENKGGLKMDTLSNIQDSQKKALQDNIAILKKDLEEAAKREKELMSLVDKAVVMRDEAIKKIKELELKARNATGAGSTRIAQLEKQLDDATRQRKEMSQRINELMAQLKGKAA